jgi:hypothetical protein
LRSSERREIGADASARQVIWLRGLPRLGGERSPKICAVQLFDRIHSHLFDVSNLIQGGAHQSTQADHSAKSTPTAPCLGSKASFPNYAVELEERCSP